MNRERLSAPALLLALCAAACNERFEFDIPNDTGTVAVTSVGGTQSSTAGGTGTVTGTDGAAGRGSVDCRTDCASSGLTCDPETGDCVACLADADCSANWPRCKLTAKRCVECVVNGDCSSGHECDARSGRCVQTCQRLSDCVAPVHDCHDGRCVACDRDVECNDPEYPLCAEGGLDCVACRVDAECSPEERCDVLGGTCVLCLSSADCPEAEVCDPATRTCAAL